MQVRRYELAITTTGSAGSAAGTGTITVDPPGYLEWVRYDFHASAPATTDVTGTMASTASPPSTVVFTSTNSTTDTTQYPRAGVVLPAGTAVTDGSTPILLAGAISVAVAQCDALTGAVTVYVGVREK